ncbi:MAG: lipopolysaccharide biosynthesis protein [Methylophilaceae bacterium]|nr:lipopolysaccharide biosynthesis protein [Methylophilaceae bacterium]
MAAEYELTINDYISIFKRRWIYIAVIFTSIFSIAIVIATILPPIYQSTGTILVEAQQIPTDIVKSNTTDYAEERIAVIKQSVMTRDNLYNIIKKYNLYDKKREVETISSLIDDMRSDVNVVLAEATNNNYYSRPTTISFKVSFDYYKPDLAQKVANELVTLFLNENVKTRTERALETTAFLTEESDRLKSELETIERKVAAYKQEHSGALPEEAAAQMSMLERSQMEVSLLDRDYRDAQDQIKFLGLELANAKMLYQNRSSGSNPNISDLDRAKADLDAALITYKESHPTVKALKRRVEALQASSSGNTSNVASSISTDLVSGRIQAQIDAARSRLSSIQQQQSAMRSKANQVQSRLVQSPQVELGLVNLMRDYDNAKAKYEQLKTNQQNAKINQKLEQENKSERFTMLEPPLYPEKPIKPDRKKVVLAGFAGALAAAFGFAMLLEMLNSKVRGADELFSITMIKPLVVIPYLSNKNEKLRRYKLIKYTLIGILIFIVFALLTVHIFIMPMDQVIDKIIFRFA